MEDQHWGRHLGVRGEMVEISRVGTQELSVEWRLQEFMSMRGDMHSPRFSLGDEIWMFKFWLERKGTPTRRDLLTGQMGLLLCRWSGDSNKTYRVSVGIRGAKGVEMRRGTVGKLGLSWSDFCPRSLLMEHGSRLMPDGVLNITCVMKRSDAATVVTNDDKDGEDDKASKIGKNCVQQNQEENAKKRIEKLSEDFGKLLACGENSDVTVHVGDVDFKVHSAVLFARSPALSVSLRHESAEKASNKITIQDSEPEVFKAFLQYLYTGSVQLLTGKNAFGLYRVADKYLADDLKQHCLEFILDTLSVQSFCDAVKLALTHGESGLLERAIAFATENIRTIIRSVEWQNFNREYPTEANEVLIKSLGPPC